MSAGQRTGSPLLSWMESGAQSMLGGRRMAQTQQKSAEQFTAATLRRAGVDGTRATQDVMDNAFTALGQRYEQMGRAANVVGDRMFPKRLHDIVTKYHDRSSNAMRVPLVEKMANEISKLASRPGGMTGQQYNAFRSQLRSAERGLKNDPLAKTAINRLVEALDVQMVRSAPRELRTQVAGYMRNTNDQYRALLAIADAAADSGLVTPAQLKIALKKQSKRGYARGRRDLDRLANAGEQVIKPLPSSGTAERSMAQTIIKAPASAVGGGFGAGTFMMGADPLTALATAAVPLATQVATTRRLTNPTIQRWLANQQVTGRTAGQARRNALMTPWLASREDYNQ
jgi:hypothetical protein